MPKMTKGTVSVRTLYNKELGLESTFRMDKDGKWTFTVDEKMAEALGFTFSGGYHTAEIDGIEFRRKQCKSFK